MKNRLKEGELNGSSGLFRSKENKLHIKHEIFSGSAYKITNSVFSVHYILSLCLFFHDMFMFLFN